MAIPTNTSPRPKRHPQAFLQSVFNDPRRALELEAGEDGWELNQLLSLKRWPALVVLLLLGLIYGTLSERLTGGYGFLLLPLLGVMIVPLMIARVRGRHHLLHIMVLLIIVLVTVTLIISIVLLILSLPNHSIEAVPLLKDAALLWASIVLVFALWYWQLDGGGPYYRHRYPKRYHRTSDLLFPQLTMTDTRPQNKTWLPGFVDYLFVAFNTSTAFSPTDTPVLSGQIKILTILQSTLSLVTLATLAARAINIL